MFKEGDKVKVVSNRFPHLPSYIGKRGTVVGGSSLLEHSCRVKLVGMNEMWFASDELEKIE